MDWTAGEAHTRARWLPIKGSGEYCYKLQLRRSGHSGLASGERSEGQTHIEYTSFFHVLSRVLNPSLGLNPVGRVCSFSPELSQCRGCSRNQSHFRGLSWFQWDDCFVPSSAPSFPLALSLEDAAFLRCYCRDRSPTGSKLMPFVLRFHFCSAIPNARSSTLLEPSAPSTSSKATSASAPSSSSRTTSSTSSSTATGIAFLPRLVLRFGLIVNEQRIQRQRVWENIISYRAASDVNRVK